jgi:pimeloyl-ACP methyl ester carboxylesterase/uncharacterized membrane protein YbhN (UPF0104 family)
MSTSRLPSAGPRAAWLRPVPHACARAGTVPAVATARPGPRWGGKRVARIVAAVLAVAALAGAGVTGRAALAASLVVLGHLHWIWIPVVLALESASMAAGAIMLRRLLAAGGARVGVRPMLATTYAANALSVSVPVAGPGLATAFTFRRFSRQGADGPLAGWTLLAGGVFSSAAAALIAAGGALASGNILATAVAVPGGVLAVAALAALGAAARWPRLRDALERPAARALRHGARLIRRPIDDSRQSVRAWAERLGSLRLPPSGWITVTGLALANWLTDAAVLAVSIHAAGAAVPWHVLLLVYGSGIAAQSLNITPGGLGVAEGTLALSLVATGLRASQALAAVLLYRLVSFWLVAFAGWLVFLWLRHRRPARRDTTTAWTLPSPNQASQPTAAAEPAHHAAREQHTGVAAGAATTGMPGKLHAHELVLLHGQPGSAADWQQVTGRLPAQLHAVAADRPGYGSSPLPAAGFAAGARAVLDELDSHGIQRVVLVGHSYGGGVALSAASLAPHRVEGVVLLASVGPGCVNGWDRLLAAPGAGPLCALAAWRLTPWIARARLARIARRRGSPLGPGEHVSWHIWGHTSSQHTPLWRTFLTEQRAMLRELDGLVAAVPSIRAPVLLLADPNDTLVPLDTARRLAQALPDARLQLVEGAGHHLPRRAPEAVASAIAAFMAAIEAPDSPRITPATSLSRTARVTAPVVLADPPGALPAQRAQRAVAGALRRRRWLAVCGHSRGGGREHLMSPIRDSSQEAARQPGPVPCNRGKDSKW